MKNILVRLEVVEQADRAYGGNPPEETVIYKGEIGMGEDWNYDNVDQMQNKADVALQAHITKECANSDHKDEYGESYVEDEICTNCGRLVEREEPDYDSQAKQQRLERE